jgi:hypothetical protein
MRPVLGLAERLFHEAMRPIYRAQVLVALIAIPVEMGRFRLRP